MATSDKCFLAYHLKYLLISDKYIAFHANQTYKVSYGYMNVTFIEELDYIILLFVKQNIKLLHFIRI